jgi:hypothetical protein
MPRVLIVASDLLRDLGVSRAPRDAQRSSVARWLAGNEPSAVLLASLRRADLI